MIQSLIARHVKALLKSCSKSDLTDRKTLHLLIFWQSAFTPKSVYYSVLNDLQFVQPQTFHQKRISTTKTTTFIVSSPS